MGNHHHLTSIADVTPLRVCGRYTRYESYSPDELIDLFDFSDDDRVQVLVQALAAAMEYEEAYNELSNEFDTEFEKPDTKDAMQEELAYLRKRVAELEDNNTKARRSASRARKRNEALKKELSDVRKALEFYSKPINSMRRKTPRKVKVPG